VGTLDFTRRFGLYKFRGPQIHEKAPATVTTNAGPEARLERA